MSKQIKKIEKILSDTDKSSINEFDIVFLIDSTASMGPYIEAAKSESKNISKILRNTYPEMNFQYGYIFYRDPIDAKDDIHEMINLTDQVNDLPSEIGKIRAIGGGDLPEDWVGAYKKVNNDINWRNGNKVIFHIADAGAHGKRFTPSDKYPDEEKKLIKEIEKCCSKNIKIFAFVIEEDSRNSFIECKKIYKSKGGTYEIYNFEKPKNIGYNEYNLFCSSKTNSLFGCYENSSSGLFGNNNEENKNSIGSLFGTKNESNTNSTSLFANNNENKNIFVNDTGGFLQIIKILAQIYSLQIIMKIIYCLIILVVYLEIIKIVALIYSLQIIMKIITYLLIILVVYLEIMKIIITQILYLQIKMKIITQLVYLEPTKIIIIQSHYLQITMKIITYLLIILLVHLTIITI